MTEGRARRGLPRLLLAAALVGAALVPTAHAADSRAIGWILTRTSNAAVPIEGSLVASGMSGRSAVVMFATTGTRTNRRLDYRFTTTTAEWGVDGWAQVHDDRLPPIACPAACQSPYGIQQTVYISSNGRALSSTVYVAAYDIQSPILTVTSPGWSVHRWQPHWQAITTSDATGSTTVTAAHTAAGVYRGGQLTGGPYGSFASSQLPCDLSGTGSAIFTGGTRSWRMSCSYVTSLADAWAQRTTWRVDGEVTGASWATAVLIVVDYPR